MKKRKLFQALAEGPDKHAERVLRADRADLNLKKVADLRRRDLDWSELNEAFLSVCSCCCVVMPGKQLSSDEHRLLDRFSVAVYPWKPSLDYFVDVLRRKDIIWLTNDDEVEIIRGEVRDDAPPDSQTGFLIASRLVGGWVAGVEWLDFVRRKGKAVQPVLQLGRAISVARELVCHNSLPTSSLVRQIVSAAGTLESGKCAWTVRECRKNLRLGRTQSCSVRIMYLIFGLGTNCRYQGPRSGPGCLCLMMWPRNRERRINPGSSVRQDCL